MKRKNKLIVFLGIALILAILIWLALNRGAPVQSSGHAVPEFSEFATSPAAITDPQASVPPAVEERIRQRQAEREWTRTRPISFYGVAVDETNGPVSGASVAFQWSDMSHEGASSTTTTPDSEGRFSLTGVLGKSLDVRVSHSSYYTMRSNQLRFDYADSSRADFHDPNLANPVVFHLRHRGQGAELIVSQYGMFENLDISGIPKDGTPRYVDLFNRRVGDTGHLGIAQIKPPYETWKQATNWSYSLSVPNGGIKEHNEEFPFEAPDSGYQPIIEFHFQKGDTNWSTRLKKDFFIMFGSPPHFGRISVETSISTGTTIQYAINPTGSRNLEPAEPKRVRRELPPGVREVIPDHAR